MIFHSTNGGSIKITLKERNFGNLNLCEAFKEQIYLKIIKKVTPFIFKMLGQFIILKQVGLERFHLKEKLSFYFKTDKEKTKTKECF